jgi:hypothetical protein
MTSTQARIMQLQVAAFRHRIPLSQSLALHIVNEFVMDAAAIASYLTKILEGVDGEAAVQDCLDKGWLVELPTGTLVLTKDGRRTLGELSA